MLDHPETVRGLRVLDFATGSGLVAIAAARAGAAEVIAADIDPFCAAAVRLNAAANGVTVAFDGRDLIGDARDFDVLLAGDVFYDRAFADRLTPWLSQLADARRDGAGRRSRPRLPAARTAGASLRNTRFR